MNIGETITRAVPPPTPLLDLASGAQSRLSFALCFLNAYQDADVFAQLEKQLAVPSGLAWIWWGVGQASKTPQK